MTTQARYLNSVLEYFDSVTAERVARLAPVQFSDDFLYRAALPDPWGTRDTNGATEAPVANGASGIMALTLAATNEVELAGIDFADHRPFVLNQGLIFEARVRLPTLPTGAVVAAIGLCGNHNAAVNTVAESIWFRADGSGALTVETDDTVHETSLVSTGVTLGTSDWAVLRIDCTNISAIEFYINGNRVASGTTFNCSQVAALALQPVARIGKEGAAASVGTLYVDYIKIWQSRS